MLLHQAVHPKNNSYIIDKGGWIQHITNQLIHKSNRFIHQKEGFNTSQINHPQIDPYNIEGGEGRPEGGESEIAPGRVSLVSRWRPPLTTPMQDLRPHPQSPPP
jgi:hypothetical protein